MGVQRVGGLLARMSCALVVIAAAHVAHSQTLTVAAAASLRESFTELAKSFESRHSGVHVRLSFAGSQSIAASILLDAPVDVFASADEVQMQRVIDGKKASKSSPLCSNRLVIVVNRSVALRIHSLADLGKPGIRVALANSKVPVGAYTDKVFARLPSVETAAIQAHVRTRDPDVRTVLTRVSLGEVDAGIVYATDAAVGKDIAVVPIGREVQAPILYVIAPLSHSHVSRLAQQFVALALSTQGQLVLARHGFLPAPKSIP